MSDLFQTRSQAHRPATQLNAGRLWAGGMATALVAGLIAVVGILVTRGLFGVSVLAPRSAGVFSPLRSGLARGLAGWPHYGGSPTVCAGPHECGSSPC